MSSMVAGRGGDVQTSEARTRVQNGSINTNKDVNFVETYRAIEQAVVLKQTDHPVFYQNDVDIDLNKKIGTDWMPKGQQKCITTQGHNQNIISQAHSIRIRDESIMSIAAKYVLIYYQPVRDITANISLSENHYDGH